MIKNNLLIILLLISFSFFWHACQGLGDASEDLGNGYVYRSDGGMRWINPGGSIYVEGIEGNVLKYKYNQDYILAIQEPSEEYYKKHFSSILIYKYSGMLYDSAAVTNADLHQKKFLNSTWWQDSTLRNSIAAHISHDNNNDYEKIAPIVDSVIKNNPYYKRIFSRELNYWIIRKKDDELFGPFSKEEYLSKRNELDIPKELAFDKD